MLDALRPTRIVGSDGDQHAIADGIPVEEGDALVVATSGTSGQPKGVVLTHDASVLDKPNRWGKKVAEVHQSKNVHVVGIALNYMRIRMKNGLEGYIPTTALE